MKKANVASSKPRRYSGESTVGLHPIEMAGRSHKVIACKGACQNASEVGEAGAGSVTDSAQSIASVATELRKQRELMKTEIIVQHRQTRAYVGCGEQHHWTDRAVMARLFETPYHALHFCVDKDVQNADVIFRSPDGQEARFLRC